MLPSSGRWRAEQKLLSAHALWKENRDRAARIVNVPKRESPGVIFPILPHAPGTSWGMRYPCLNFALVGAPHGACFMKVCEGFEEEEKRAVSRFELWHVGLSWSSSWSTT